MTSKFSKDQSSRLIDEAALWYVRVQDPDFSMADRTAFADWLAGSAEHVREYLLLAVLTAELSKLGVAPSVDELIRASRAEKDDANVIALSGRRFAAENNSSDKRRKAMSSPIRWASAAAVMLALTSSVWYQSGLLSDSKHTTGVGEQVSFPLEDGSVVMLNAQSKIHIAYTDDQRIVRMTAGEAIFEVAKDPARPFKVITDQAVIQAVGTAFNVRHRGEGTRVTVLEGTIEIFSPDTEFGTSESTETSNQGFASLMSPVRLTVGQQAKIARQSGRVSVLNTNINKTIAWRERRLVFESHTLAEAVEEFNLYNDLQIKIANPELGKRQISGVFNANDHESFTLFLTEAELAKANSSSDGTITLSGIERN